MKDLALTLAGIPKTSAPSRGRDAGAVGILVLLGILFFFECLFTSKSFYYRDILNFHYPMHRFMISSYARGEFPLWNPSTYLGQPMLANPNYLAFYPTNLFHLFLPFNYAFKLHFVIHVIFAGIGLYFLQRRLNLPWAASLCGALAYEFSGAVLSFLNLYNIVPAVALLPWMAWAFVGALQSHPLRRSLGFGALLALQLVSPEPLVFVSEIGLLAALSFYCVLESSHKIRMLRRVFVVGTAGGLFALGLAAVQILPTLELFPRTGRGSAMNWAEASVRSMHRLDFLNLAIPNLFGNYYTLNYVTSWGESIHQGRESYLVSFFLGTITLMLAALSFFSRRRKLGLTVSCLALVSAALSLGQYNPLCHWLYDHFALFRLGRYPSKYFLLAALSVSIMASLGFEVVQQACESGSRLRGKVIVSALCCLCAGIVLLSFGVTWQSRVPLVLRWLGMEIRPELRAVKDMPAILELLKNSVTSSGIFLSLGAALAAAAPLWRRRSLVGGLMLLLMAAELLPTHFHLSPLLPGADVDFVPEVNKYLGGLSASEVCRVAPPTLLWRAEAVQLNVPDRSYAWLIFFYRLSGQPYDGIMNGIQYSLDRSVDRLVTRESDELRSACLSIPDRDALTLLAKLNSPLILALGSLNDPALSHLSSFGTASNLDLNLYRLKEAAGRVLFATKVEAVSGQSEALARFIKSDFPYKSSVLLENPPKEPASGSSGGGVAEIERYENQRVICHVEAKQAGYLVLLDSYYPGWKAFLDGAEVDILRANYAFRAVAVPAGSHTIEFRYRPASFYRGLVISSIALLLGLAAAIPTLIGRRKRADSQSGPNLPEGTDD